MKELLQNTGLPKTSLLNHMLALTLSYSIIKQASFSTETAPRNAQQEGQSGGFAAAFEVYSEPLELQYEPQADHSIGPAVAIPFELRTRQVAK